VFGRSMYFPFSTWIFSTEYVRLVEVSFGTRVGGTNSGKLAWGGTLNEVAGLEKVRERVCTGNNQPLRGVRLTRIHLFR
jgi:hypothetical protein